MLNKNESAEISTELGCIYRKLMELEPQNSLYWAQQAMEHNIKANSNAGQNDVCMCSFADHGGAHDGDDDRVLMVLAFTVGVF